MNITIRKITIAKTKSIIKDNPGFRGHRYRLVKCGLSQSKRQVDLVEQNSYPVFRLMYSRTLVPVGFCRVSYKS